jgi:hypothetical protein
MGLAISDGAVLTDVSRQRSIYFRNQPRNYAYGIASKWATSGATQSDAAVFPMLACRITAPNRDNGGNRSNESDH